MMINEKQIIMELATVLHNEYGGACMVWSMVCDLTDNCPYSETGGSPACFVRSAMLTASAGQALKDVVDSPHHEDEHTPEKQVTASERAIPHNIREEQTAQDP